MKFQELDYEDLVITTDEINHEDFPNNLTEEQADNLWGCLTIVERFGYELNLEIPVNPLSYPKLFSLS